MVVGDFHLIHALLRPAEAEAILLVDANAVLGDYPKELLDDCREEILGRQGELPHRESTVWFWRVCECQQEISVR